MKTISKNAFCVLLSVLMLATMFAIGGFSAAAATTDLEESGDGTYKVYCKSSWSPVYCYMWNSSSDENHAWPGEAMTLIDSAEGIWEYTASKSYANVIFNQNKSPQTGDLVYSGDGVYYDTDAGQWVEYDKNPLQLKSFEGSLASPQYTGSQIVFTVNGESDSIIQYQYSVNNEIKQSYSTNSSFTWTPTAAGTYTIKLDAKDGSGNTNSKTLTYEIKDPSAEVKPVFLSSSPSATSQILLNATTNLSVKAAGGNTGTKLLFYKYVVKDPSGVQMNTAYYTLNNTYSFTPKTAGTYTVEVSIQGSDNQSVTQKLSYEATGNITTSETEPSSSIVITGKKGDVNNDGDVNIQDATVIQKKVAYMSVGTFISSKADVDGDGDITVKDATRIQKFLVGTISTL